MDTLFPLESYTANVAKAKPFLKWAGGKSQLLEQIRNLLPRELENGEIARYVEPFVGGGAVFFDTSQNFPLNEFVLLDINEDLVLAYLTIKFVADDLITVLAEMENEYRSLPVEDQSTYFYKTRAVLNETKSQTDYRSFNPDWITRTARILFLNRTCFNGLFRVNSKGEFNVPFGRYTNPTICPSENLRRVSQVLQSAEIRVGDFEESEPFVDSHTFVYFDPPYRPLNKTANFTSYAASTFNENDQLRLAGFFRKLDRLGARLMLSNSDPKNENPDDDFFEKAYAGFRIERVRASRMINCDAQKRGRIHEVIVTNY